MLYLALAFACLLSVSVALGAAAPSLALEWPRVFACVVQLKEQLGLVAAWVVCAAITLAHLGTYRLRRLKSAQLQVNRRGKPPPG